MWAGVGVHVCAGYSCVDVDVRARAGVYVCVCVIV